MNDELNNRKEISRPENNTTGVSALQTACSIASVLIALLAIPQLPTLRNRILIGVAVVVLMLVIAYTSVLSLIWKSVQALFQTRKQDKLAKAFAATFSQLVEQFKEITSESGRNSIHYRLIQVRNTNPQIAAHDNYLHSLLWAFHQSSWKQMKSKKDFALFSLWFDSIQVAFNNDVCHYVRVMKNTPSLKLEYDFYDNYQNSKAEYDAFIRKYNEFAKEV